MHRDLEELGRLQLRLGVRTWGVRDMKERWRWTLGLKVGDGSLFLASAGLDSPRSCKPRSRARRFHRGGVPHLHLSRVAAGVQFTTSNALAEAEKEKALC